MIAKAYWESPGGPVVTLGALTGRGQFQPLIGEQRPCKTHDTAKK